MTPEQLIAEGRLLQRECFFLEREGSGDIAAVWYDRFLHNDACSPLRRLLTVDTRFIPAFRDSTRAYLTVSCNEDNYKAGVVELAQTWSPDTGTPLYARRVSVLPPIDAVFAKGSKLVQDWIRSYGWSPEYRYNDNFKGRDVVDEYVSIFMNEFPMYLRKAPVAVLGGWHWNGPDRDWHDLMDEELLVLTIEDAEPWVEAWRLASGEFKVIERIT